jgi:hypothetical protein
VDFPDPLGPMIAMIDPGSAYPATKEFKLQIDHRRYHMQNVWSGELLSGNVSHIGRRSQRSELLLSRNETKYWAANKAFK